MKHLLTFATLAGLAGGALAPLNPGIAPPLLLEPNSSYTSATPWRILAADPLLDASSSDVHAPPNMNELLQNEQLAERHLKVVSEYSKWEAEKAAAAKVALDKHLAQADKFYSNARSGSLGAQAGAQHAQLEALVTRSHEQVLAEAQARQQQHSKAITERATVLNDTGIFDRGSSTPVISSTQAKYTWETYVANVDAQEAIDKCTGGLTYSPETSEVIDKSYYPIHNGCGGLPILDLKNGDTVKIDGVGDFQVVDSRVVNKGDSTAAISGLNGSVVLQTCYESPSTQMRVVGLNPTSSSGSKLPFTSLAEALSMLDTSSVLFPTTSLLEKRRAAQMTSFQSRIADIPSQEVTIAQIAEVYTGPGIDYRVLDVMLPGATTRVDGKLGHWLRLSGGLGFISALDTEDYGKDIITSYSRSLSVTDAETPTWYTEVTSVGNTDKVNICYGGLTELTDFEEKLGLPYYGVHYFCGGEPALELETGAQVAIGKTLYTVSDVSTYPMTGNATNISVPDGTDAMVHVTDLEMGQARVLSLQQMGN
jgi:hypothetical protein